MGDITVCKHSFAIQIWNEQLLVGTLTGQVTSAWVSLHGSNQSTYKSHAYHGEIFFKDPQWEYILDLVRINFGLVRPKMVSMSYVHI